MSGGGNRSIIAKTFGVNSTLSSRRTRALRATALKLGRDIDASSSCENIFLTTSIISSEEMLTGTSLFDVNLHLLRLPDLLLSVFLERNVRVFL